ncbi:Kinetochore protein Nuf2 [Liparis tanakae]|uniref:Kinetochore protein Nuf2 n=1 Tax=Liparis tanakae TaxID=230148 RepID=A0A4Z2INZ8_9TELE|nr:Kinetochore protein Nuf2 [Liparis tanakae]
MSENTFPIYTPDAIVHFYRTEVLTGQEAKHFTKGDLTPTPKPEAIQTLYMRVLHLLFRFRPECHSMVPLLENIQNPVYHEGATAIMSVYIRMQQFLPMCLVYDFSLNDLLAPKKQKTLTVLSAIMNFLHFRKQRMDLVYEKQAKFVCDVAPCWCSDGGVGLKRSGLVSRGSTRADMDRLQAYTKGNKEAEKKIEALTTIPPEQQAEADELAAVLSELQAANIHEYQEVAQVKVDICNLKEDVGKLKSQIVESPEELKTQMEKMRENVKNIKSSIKEIDERMVELQNMVQSVTHTEAEIQQMFSLLQDLESSMNNTKQRADERGQITDGPLGGAKCNQIHQRREEMADRIQEISRETQQLKANIQSLRDVSSKETAKAQALYDTLSASMDELHERIETHIVDLKQDVTKMSAHF